MEKRWFHREDGGVINTDAYPWPCCSICGQDWLYFGFWEEAPIGGIGPAWVRFSELPEDLQTVALSEML